MKSILPAIFARLVTVGSLAVAVGRGGAQMIGDGTGEPVAVRFADARAAWAFLLDPELRLGELFTDGRLVVERGTIYDFLALVLREGKGKGKRPNLAERVLDATRHALRKALLDTAKAGSKRNAAFHYDLDGHVYDWMLDANRQYSCAFFEGPGMTLDEAQLAKMRHIAAKLLVEPGQRVLDIGCGWGGLAFYLAGVAGAGHVSGISLAEKQIAFAKDLASKKDQWSANKLGGRVDFALTDYRDVAGTFDRVVSVGMLEHVGPSHYRAYFAAVARALRGDGVALIHTIGCADGVNHPNPWLNKYIFPGGYLPALSELMPAIEAAGLLVADVEVWHLHYALTLQEWRRRFMARRAQAVAIHGERFCLMWEFYLSMSEAAFRFEDVVVFQLQLVKRQDARPPTRGYIEARKAGLRAREALLPKDRRDDAMS